MNRMFRFNMRKSHHRVDSMMVPTFPTTRSERNSKNDTHQEPLPLRSGKKNQSNGSKQRSLTNVKTNKKKSLSIATSAPLLRCVQSEKSLDVYTHNGGDTSETDLTVPHVDSSFSQNSDIEKDVVTSATNNTAHESPSSMTDVYSSNDCQDYVDDVVIPFLGDVFEYDCDNDDLGEKNKEGDDPIVILSLQASQKVLDDAYTTYGVDFTAAFVSDIGISAASSPNKKRMEQSYVKLDQEGNSYVEKGESEQAVIKYLQALHYKREVLLMMYPVSAGSTTVLSQKEEEKRYLQKQHVLASIATSINNLAFLQHNQSRINAIETLALYQIALQIKRYALGSQHLSVGKTLNNIGSIHYIQRDFHMAAQTYEEARTILQLHLGSHHLDICTVTSNIGDVHCSMKQWTIAAKEYRAALELRWPLYGPSDPKNIRLMEQIAEIEMLINQLNAQQEDVDQSSNHEKCYGPIIKDVRKLQKEVQRDIDHIDRQLTSQLPLEMMNEKITVNREIRDIMMNDRMDECGVDDDDYSHDSINSDEQPLAVVVSTHVFASKKSTVTSKNETKSYDVLAVSGKEDTSTPTAVHKRNTVRLQRSESTTTKKLSSPQLTSEDRQKALISVKVKLAKLRAQRESGSSSPKRTITDLQ